LQSVYERSHSQWCGPGHTGKFAASSRRGYARFITMRKKIVGIPWFKPDSFSAARAVMADGAALPEQYGDWLREAEGVRAEAEDAGHHVLKVMIEPKEFSLWCRARNIPADAKARVRFANFAAFREAGFVSGNPGRVPKGSLTRG
jgi:hypothetical protein